MTTIRDEQSDSLLECRPEDEEEGEKIKEFVRKGCGCKSKCSSAIPTTQIAASRSSCLELSRTELDMAIMGQVAASVHCNDSTSGSHKKLTARQRQRAQFSFHGHTICRTTFLFLHTISASRLKAIYQHYQQFGLTPRQHGNKKRLPKHSLKVEDVERVVSFIFNYSETHAMLLPGRVPGYKRSDIKLLPSSTTKLSLIHI